MPSWSGLSDEQYAAMPDQDVCPLCGRAYIPSNTLRKRVLDHRHEDGLVRGYCCSGCNQRLEENIEWLCAMIDFLTLPPAVLAIGEHYIPGSLGRYRQDNPDE